MTTSQSWILRPAKSTDAETIRRIVRDNRLNPLSIHWENFLVAEADGRIIAIGQVKQHGDGSRELASIATIPEWREKGVASEIIRALMEKERRPLYLTCRSEMQPFYRRFGFRSVTIAEMSPYFRRLYRIASVFIRLRGASSGMAVMLHAAPSR